jgi:hypothetical protein
MTRPDVLVLPEEVADAIMVARALCAPDVADGLLHRFGAENFDATLSTARSTLGWAMDNSRPSLATITEVAQEERNRALGYHDADLEDATLPGALADVRAEAPILPLEEGPGLRGLQAKIALDALRTAARTPGQIVRANDTLSRVAPGRFERVARTGVVRMAIGLSTLLH